MLRVMCLLIWTSLPERINQGSHSVLKKIKLYPLKAEFITQYLTTLCK